MYDISQSAKLFADCNRGVYIPQHFAESVRREFVSNVSPEDWAILESGPDHEHYWDAWNDVEMNAILTDESGEQWRLYQDGDLWIIPVNA